MRGKKGLTGFLFCILLLSMAAACINKHSVTVNADIEMEGDWEYEVQEDGTVQIILYTGSDEEVKIPGTFGGCQVTGIAEYAFSGNMMTGITFPDSIRQIGEYAFSNCMELKKVTIPKGVKEIPEFAFSGCTELSTVKFHDSITKIGESAFLDCENLTAVTLPKSVQDIGEFAFSNCTTLKNITIPGSVQAIRLEAFSGCTALKKVTIENGVQSIEAYAFYNCEKLTQIVVPSSVKELDDTAFDNCADNLVIVAPKDSEGEKFASENNIKTEEKTNQGNTGQGNTGQGNTNQEGTSSGEENTISGNGKPGKVKGFKAAAGKGKLTLRWKKMSGVSGYQIQFGRKKNFKGAKSVSVAKAATGYKVKGLKNKKYYIRIRAYIKEKASDGTKKVYGKWVTRAKKVK